jgi:hypothetical protein
MIKEVQLKRLGFAAAFAGSVLFALPALAQDDEAVRQERWQDLTQAIFGQRQIQSGDGRLFWTRQTARLMPRLSPWPFMSKIRRMSKASIL